MGEPAKQLPQSQERTLPTIELNWRAIDLAGREYGELTVLRPVGHTAKRSVIWECRCSCGRLALRSRTVLQQARGAGRRQSCCEQCLLELRRRNRAAGRKKRRSYYRKMWEEQGSLYSWISDERIEERIRADMLDKHGLFLVDPDEQRLARRIEQFGYLSIDDTCVWSPHVD